MRNTTYLSAILLLVFINFFCLSCKRESDFKAGFIHPSKNRQRFVKEASFFAERIKQLGGEAIIDDGDDNDALQLERGLKMLDQGIDVLVITAVNGNTIGPLVREAQKRGVKVIAYLRLINNVKYDAFVTCDNFFMAQTWCNMALKRFPQGNYVIIAGDRFDKNAVEEKLGIDSVLNPEIKNGRIKLLYSGYMENWSRDMAKYEVEQVFESFGKNIQTIITCNDQMGDGVLEVLKKYKLEGKVFICGQDADPVGLKNIKDNFQDMTFYHPNKELGTTTADVAYNVLKNKFDKTMYSSFSFNGVTDIPTVRIKSIPITISNIIDVGKY